mmetsp:Transcript_168844/g.542663  ORF Transcript_168844/g.542663 Transcript_168844/m.542663 type:complete len:258 (+) Transcript_168844:585-1358(+)
MEPPEALLERPALDDRPSAIEPALEQCAKPQRGRPLLILLILPSFEHLAERDTQRLVEDDTVDLGSIDSVQEHHGLIEDRLEQARQRVRQQEVAASQLTVLSWWERLQCDWHFVPRQNIRQRQTRRSDLAHELARRLEASRQRGSLLQIGEAHGPRSVEVPPNGPRREPGPRLRELRGAAAGLEDGVLHEGRSPILHRHGPALPGIVASRRPAQQGDQPHGLPVRSAREAQELPERRPLLAHHARSAEPPAIAGPGD